MPSSARFSFANFTTWYFKDLDIIQNRIRDFYFYKNYKNNIKNNIDFYFEFPPLVKIKMKTKKPLLKKINLKSSELFKELKFYNYITFIKLK